MEDGLHVDLCVIASSSSGNCTVLRFTRAGETQTILVDAGLSPRRTLSFLNDHNLPSPTAMILTHLDADHWHNGWLNSFPQGARVYLHKRHLKRAERCGLAYLPTEVFVESFEPLCGVRFHPLLVAHDDLGSAAFLIEFIDTGRRLGFATDIGVPTATLCDHLKDCDILAIESNYCPQLLARSNRPDFLKQRISGGKGHLSNQQSARAVESIAPRERVVLLHLSSECNNIDAACAAHGKHRPLTIAQRNAPTEWVRVVSNQHYSASRAPRGDAAGTLFSALM